MEEQENYIDNLKERREFFQKNFALKIGRQRTDVNSEDVLKNSCPVCGYLTLDERDSFDTCTICFWEDDGADDLEENEDSGPNYLTLKEGRRIFQEAKTKLLNANNTENHFIVELKVKFLKLDNLIEQKISDKTEILRLQSELIELLIKSKVYGIEKLFEK